MYAEVKRLCKENKLTVTKLEEIIGVGKNTLNRWDTNSPSVDKVKKVADYFGVTVDELLK